MSRHLAVIPAYAELATVGEVVERARLQEAGDEPEWVLAEVGMCRRDRAFRPAGKR